MFSVTPAAIGPSAVLLMRWWPLAALSASLTRVGGDAFALLAELTLDDAP